MNWQGNRGKDLVEVQSLLRLVSWNMAYGKPGRYKTLANRRRQWALLGALAPDIALLQECRPSDLHYHAPEWMADEYECAGLVPPGGRLCSSILVRKTFCVKPLDPAACLEAERRWLGYLSGCVAAGTVSANGCEFAVASVHAFARRVEVGTVTLADHEGIRRTGLDRAIYSDLAAAALEPWVKGRRFLVGGDWNDSPLFDTNYRKGVYGVAGSSTEFFDRRRTAGWCDAMRRCHHNQVRTYLDPTSQPYELDHVFTDAETRDQLVECHVVDDAAVAGLSDHAPLVFDFAL